MSERTKTHRTIIHGSSYKCMTVLYPSVSNSSYMYEHASKELETRTRTIHVVLT